MIFQSIYYFLHSVWQKLEEENADFFRAYYIRLKLKKQILLFNHLLEHQYHLMNYPVPPKVPLAPIQNGIHPMPGKFSVMCFCMPVYQHSRQMADCSLIPYSEVSYKVDACVTVILYIQFVKASVLSQNFGKCHFL